MLREIISRCKTIKYCADNFTQDFGLDCELAFKFLNLNIFEHYDMNKNLLYKYESKE